MLFTVPVAMSTFLLAIAMQQTSVNGSSASSLATTQSYREDISSALNALRHYQTSGSLVDLRGAVDDLGHVSIDPAEPANNTSTRRSLVQAWTEVFVAIDPTFDPNDTSQWPSSNVVPPAGYPVGVSPNQISDLRLRAAYKRSVDDNAAKANRLRQQTTLRDIATTAVDDFSVSANNFREATPPDSHALDIILNQSQLGQSRIQQLLRLLS